VTPTPTLVDHRTPDCPIVYPDPIIVGTDPVTLNPTGL
jgi:hypothetical protein